jgi:hypothetical protein
MQCEAASEEWGKGCTDLRGGGALARTIWTGQDDPQTGRVLDPPDPSANDPDGEERGPQNATRPDRPEQRSAIGVFENGSAFTYSVGEPCGEASPENTARRRFEFGGVCPRVKSCELEGRRPRTLLPHVLGNNIGRFPGRVGAVDPRCGTRVGEEWSHRYGEPADPSDIATCVDRQSRDANPLRSAEDPASRFPNVVLNQLHRSIPVKPSSAYDGRPRCVPGAPDPEVDIVLVEGSSTIVEQRGINAGIPKAFLDRGDDLDHIHVVPTKLVIVLDDGVDQCLLRRVAGVRLERAAWADAGSLPLG